MRGTGGIPSPACRDSYSRHGSPRGFAFKNGRVTVGGISRTGFRVKESCRPSLTKGMAVPDYENPPPRQTVLHPVFPSPPSHSRTDSGSPMGRQARLDADDVHGYSALDEHRYVDVHNPRGIISRPSLVAWGVNWASRVHENRVFSSSLVRKRLGSIMA